MSTTMSKHSLDLETLKQSSNIVTNTLEVSVAPVKKEKNTFKGFEIAEIKLLACQSLEDIIRLLNINGLVRNPKAIVAMKNWDLTKIHNRHIRTSVESSSTEKHYIEVSPLTEFFNSNFPITETELEKARIFISQCKDSIDNLMRAHKLTERYLSDVTDDFEIEKTHKYLKGLRNTKYHYQAVLLALNVIYFPQQADKQYSEADVAYFFRELATSTVAK